MLGKLFGKKKVSLEDQLLRLKEIGIDLNPGFSIEHLLTEFNRNEYEKGPYSLLLVAMGGEVEVEDENWVPISNKVWHFDTECIEDHGDYVSIAHRLRDLTEGDLPIENAMDYIDIDAGQAWLSFELGGIKYKWDLVVDDDWVDTNLFAKFADLLSLHDSGKSFAMMDLKGQDFLILFLEPSQLEKLNNLPNLNIELLK